MKVYDASDAITGRLCALVAHQLLQSEEVRIVNAEKAVISGDPSGITLKYFKRRLQQQKGDPAKSPSQSWSRRPDFLMRRIVKGMLPKNSNRGRDALRKLRVYIGLPTELRGEKLEKPVKTSEKLSSKYATLQEVSESLGWQPRMKI